MLRFAAAIVTLSSLVLACSGDDTTPYESSSPSPSPTSSSQGSSPSSPSSPTALNGCTTFADGDAITWTLASKPPSTCLRVRKGGTVTWSGDLGIHPLAPKGGDAANPIIEVSSGSSKTITFDKPGTFGFVCASHASMTGAISVVE